ncbi:hypothetical protein BU26DRAFT_96452 [Trematosphaeria pertusa]|uniref:Uncharacterized protein n=1 Tax=Trematosphaeria pertusa TaxID=390896 RepID=A0A6A6I1B7_9PLEO|nr:uncharacterized protein BU26DRAFT_96452 [Trematosphaeria pertusa]KAF2244245.1 hypothetical protein BU26DRAFT_96452 [Trematosphaeria pertusa]
MSLAHLLARELSTFSPTCPSGGTWYACASGSKFVGCCTSDPCTNGCSQGNIQPVAFNASAYGTYPDASCGASSTFYSCLSPDNATTFWGCCKSMPCDHTECPSGDLVPAFMERPEQFNAYATSAPSSTGSAPSATATGGLDAGGNEGTSHTTAIIGGAVGGGLGVAIIIALLIFFLCRRKKKSEEGKSSGLDQPPKVEKNDYRASTLTEAPPKYSSPNPNMYAHSPSHPAYSHHYHPVATELQPQELPAEMSPGSPSLQPPPNTQRYSELPADAAAARTAAELESPVPSPKPAQSSFALRSPPKRSTGLGF